MTTKTDKNPFGKWTREIDGCKPPCVYWSRQTKDNSCYIELAREFGRKTWTILFYGKQSPQIRELYYKCNQDCPSSSVIEIKKTIDAFLKKISKLKVFW